MPRTQPFPWGAWVLVRRQAKAMEHQPDPTRHATWIRVWEPLEDRPRYGRICGLAYKQNGTIRTNGTDGASFKCTQSVKLFRVAVTWRSEILAFPEDIELCEDRGDLPMQCNSWENR